MPDYGVSTPEAFAAYDKVGSSTHPDCEAQEKAIRAEDLAGVCAAAGNALEECSGARDNEAIKTCLLYTSRPSSLSCRSPTTPPVR